MSIKRQLAVQVIGDGVPVLVIPGWQMNGLGEAVDLEPCFSDQSGFKRLYVDLPGMGSTPADGIQSQDDIFLRLIHFIETNIADSRFLVTGSSCGAYLARAVAARFRHQIDGLLLRVPLIEPADSKRDLDDASPIISNPDLMEQLPPSEKEWLGNVLIQTPQYISAAQARTAEVVRPAVIISDAAILDPIREDPDRYALSAKLFDAGAEKLTAPTLIVCGRQDDVVGYRDALRLLALYPRSTFAVLDRADHGLPLDDKRNVYQSLVSDWLDRVKEYQSHRQ